MATATQYELFSAPSGLALEQMTAFLNEGIRPPSLFSPARSVRDRPVSLKLTRNRVSMVSIDFSAGGPVRVRLHEAFLRAPHEVLDALRRTIRGQGVLGAREARQLWRTVTRYAQGIEVGGGPRRRTRLVARGRVYNLKAIMTEVNATHFSGSLDCGIGWGRRSRARGRKVRSIRYGSWTPSSRTIRIHPLLDDARVPAEFVRYIIFHEMLHAVVPHERKQHRQYDHPAAFRRLEENYPRYREMRKLAKELVNVLTR